MDLDALVDRPTTRPWTPTGEGELRVACVGVGWWTREYALPALEAGENTVPTVLVTGAPERVGDVCAEYSTVEQAVSYDAFADGIAADAYDAVYVATPNGTHLDHVAAAASLGKDTLCEKPLEASVERATELVETVEAAGTRLMVGYRMQTDPTVRRLRELVRAGFVGDPVSVHAHMSQDLLAFFGADDWRLDGELGGRGCSVTDLGVYPINTARFLLDADPVSVVADGESTTPAFEGVPDERATFEVRLDDGTPVSCSVSQHAQLTGWLNVVGTDGAIELTPAFFGNDEQSLRLSHGERVEHVTYTPADQMREEFVWFADRILSGESFEANGRHGLVDMRTIDAVYDAIESGERERVSAP